MSAKVRFSRKDHIAAGHDCESWRTIDINLLPADIQIVTKNRIRAIRAFLKEGASLHEVRVKYGVGRTSLYRIIKKCESIAEDGAVLGFKGAIPYKRTSGVKYIREQGVEIADGVASQGDAGVFHQLIGESLELKNFLEKMARSYKSRNEGGDYFVALHKSFIEKCIEVGITDNQYPFNRKSRARAALRDYLIKTHKTLKAADEKRKQLASEEILHPTDILEQVEADGHMMDVRLDIEETDSFGKPIRYEILRVWLILVIDVFSRCVLGYSLALGQNYDQVDLLKAIFNSLAPHQRPSQGLMGIDYSSSGGFPSDTGSPWKTWTTIKLDNAWAHKAKHVIKVLQDRVGCVVEFGPPHVPNERSIVERFFLFIVQHYSHRIQGTTGSNSHDKIIERLSPKSKSPLKMHLTLDELKSTIDIIIADYNGRPHSSLQGHTPLEVFGFKMNEFNMPLNELPERFRSELLFTMVREEVVVKSSSKYGGAYVNFAYLKYRNPDALRSDSAGRVMFIEYSREDVSSVRLLDEEGTFIAVLFPPHPWSLHPHSLKVRSELWTATRQGQMRFAEGETIPEAFRRHRMLKSPNSRATNTALYKEIGEVRKDSNLSLERVEEDAPASQVTRVKLTKVILI